MGYLLLVMAFWGFVCCHPGMVQLTHDNFSKTNSHLFILYLCVFDGAAMINNSSMAPWCPHCKNMDQILSDVVRAYKEEHISIIVGKIDCTVETALCEEHQATGFPTLKYSAYGRVNEWTAGRSFGDFLNFGRSLKDDILIPKVDGNAFEELKAKHPIIFAVVSSGESKDHLRDMKILARQTAVYAHIKFTDVDSSLVALPPDTKLPSLVVLNMEESAPATPNDTYYLGDVDADKLYDWAIVRSTPIFGEVTSSTWALITKAGPVVIAGIYPEGGSVHRGFKETMKNAAIKLKGQYRFVWINAVKHNAWLQRSFHVYDFPQFWLYEREKNIHYIDRENSTKPITQEFVIDFLKRVELGQISAEGYGSGIIGKLLVVLGNIQALIANHPYLFAGGVVLAVCMAVAVWFFEPPLEEIIGKDEREDPSNEEEESEDEEDKKNK